MKSTKRPVRATVFFGLICSLSFIPLQVGLSYVFSWSKIFNLTIWMYLSGFGFLLTRWRGKNQPSIIFPLLLLFISVFMVSSNDAFLVLALGVFSWIRSGIYFPKPLHRALVAELGLTIGGAALVAWFTPHSNLTWALGILMFFLVQSLYFVIFENKGIKDKFAVDPFEEARSAAEKILSAYL